MDINPSNLDSSEHTIIWSDDFAKNLVETKSFRCTFCKRGFSNAQALGGHMNIHRKDRAKLKEFSSENLLSLDITKNIDRENSPPHVSSISKSLSSELIDQNPDEQAQNLHRDEEKSVRGLSLFAEAPSANGGAHGRGEEEGGCFDEHVKSRKVELKYGELDLELRLGPEPRHAKSKP